MEINFTDKNILVTGGTGFIGSHLIEELIRQKAHVISTYQTRNPHSYFYSRNLDEQTTLVYIDICNFESVFDLVTKFDIDLIFHLAAQPLVDIAYANPKRTLETNILGTTNVLESARLFPKVKGIIVASSDKAYGKTEKKYVEDTPLRGDHPYEVSKSAADLISYSYFKTYGLPVVVTRFGNVYGEGDLNFSRVIPGIMKSLATKESLKIRSDGTYIRDYIYVKDVIHGYLLLAKNIGKVKGEAFNFGSSENLSVLNLITLIEKTLQKKIDYKILNTARNEIPFQSLDYAKIEKKLGWKPKFTLCGIIKQIYDWYSNFGVL
ncbi:hypothetical protein A2960_00925 [Candidatus Gottesmanbacteria bacterium RIFCSPLOWO2_01_FULL_39_12b]|uniref:NAD(P)-binding domain-containing protein n=1 Tax=Candidatus Gottesmanbacteria bacterium RIFCSPLOWO2_01_FULL_39_12b TaxID=1798388 RepID=A0A1F6APU1_9BACT|nr:MAG: hypothetical protein A2960_00925 [Candidatus Gottesmanbacteria bacterium RIFCSPLOWO2_01_FULL_39_12b]